MTDIKNSVLLDPANSFELEYFFSTYFKDPTKIEGGKVLYGNCLIIEYSKQNKIKSILANEDVISVKKIIEDVKSILYSSDGIQVSSNFLFSPIVIENYFRYEDEFQILPVPSNAPKIDRSYINESHPFILEYTYSKSSDPFINGFRSFKRYHELAILLNSLLRHGTKLISNSQNKEWVLNFTGNNMGCEYMTTGYHLNEIDSRTKDHLGFTTIEGYSQFTFQDFDTYYKTYGYSSEDYNQYLPSNFNISLKKYFSLTRDQQQLFLNSSYWTQVASKVFNLSMSTAFSALVTSIEVFLPNPKERCSECNKPISNEACSKCNQPSAGPTKLFREFIETYSPGIEEKSRKELYDLRSSILHGGKLMTSDLKYLGYQYNSQSTSENWKWHLLHSIIKRVQNNWLNS